MKKKIDIQKKQTVFITKLLVDINKYVQNIDKNELQTVLLSGSVARGDYYPGKFGGMVDLIVLKKTDSVISPQDIFGKDEEPNIPYHCITWNNISFQIHFIDFVDYKIFQTLDEARKYSFLESKILWDENDIFSKELEIIEKYSRVDQLNKLNSSLGYISYLLSDYKKDRWYRRNAFTQMHENLNTAIRLIIQCLFYINNQYSPAEDRRLYYSYSLIKLPENYEEILNKLYEQMILSETDYIKRENIFNNYFLAFVNKNRPTTAST